MGSCCFLFGISPYDQYVYPESLFIQKTRNAAEAAEANAILLLVGCSYLDARLEDYWEGREGAGSSDLAPDSISHSAHNQP